MNLKKIDAPSPNTVFLADDRCRGESFEHQVFNHIWSPNAIVEKVFRVYNLKEEK